MLMGCSCCVRFMAASCCCEKWFVLSKLAIWHAWWLSSGSVLKDAGVVHSSEQQQREATSELQQQPAGQCHVELGMVMSHGNKTSL
ncbi:hypothetical protein COO60DRAFT_4143 [Scenedesmus sp. NREL 46B-D3]|nr:hypothetical protein COO60DRAFT_4143 [Scenedesmus sp. NREL 46B-D3]